MTHLQKYIELVAALKAARDGGNDSEADRLYWEANALTPHLIRANLGNFGIDDQTVVGVLYYSNNRSEGGTLYFRDGAEAGRIEMPISDLCGLRYSGLAKQLGIPELLELSFNIHVEKDGVRIGRVDSDGRFDYEKAPNLGDALGWMIATDGGRVGVIESFDLSDASSALLRTITAHGTSASTFFGVYFESLKRIFRCGSTSRFGDGYCGAARILWQIATRDLGEEHAGYEFAY